MQGGPGEVRPDHRARWRDRERPGHAAAWREPFLVRACELGRAAVRDWPGGRPGMGRPAVRARCLARPDPGATFARRGIGAVRGRDPVAEVLLVPRAGA